MIIMNVPYCVTETNLTRILQGIGKIQGYQELKLSDLL